jgi:hypothetical protein
MCAEREVGPTLVLRVGMNRRNVSRFRHSATRRTHCFRTILGSWVGPRSRNSTRSGLSTRRTMSPYPAVGG